MSLSNIPSKSIFRGKRVLMMGRVWPEDQSSAAGVRDWEVLRYFQDQRCDLHVVSPASINGFTDRLQQQGIQTESFQPNDSGFDDYVRALAPDFVWFDTFIMEEQFGWRVQEQVPQAFRLLDTQDLHFLRRARQKALKSGVSIERLAECRLDLQTEDAFREIASIYRCDLTLVLSDLEMKLLQDRFRVPKELLHYCPFMVSSPLADSPPFESRSNFVSIGNFRHPPNADAVAWLCAEIWPSIREKLPQAEMHVYGAYVTDEMKQLEDPQQGFLVRGFVEDQIATLSKYRVNLAPLRFGAGIKGKISDGWLAGTPVVTTLIGAEGMHGGMAWPGAVAQDPDYFARAAVSLYDEKRVWEKAQFNGYAVLKRLFDRDRVFQDLDQVVSKRWTDLEKERGENFTGAMLRYHANDRSKYFSKWIELKNQL